MAEDVSYRTKNGDNQMIYLDSAATSLYKPPCVAEAVSRALGSFGNSARGTHEASLTASRIIFETRERICIMFGAGRPERVAFTSNATESLNVVIQGLVRPGSHAVSTVLEHNSVLRPLYLQEERKAELSFADCDPAGRVRPQTIEKLIRTGTRAVVCTHASNVTGNVVDIRAVGEICRRRGVLFIVDASQTAGIFPVDMQKQNIDVLCFSGHKGLLGPQGTGCLCVREGISIPPLMVGGTGTQSYSRVQPVQMPDALEAGTQNGHGIAGLCASLSYLSEYGIDRIRTAEQALMRQFIEEVKDLPQVTLYGDFEDNDRAPVVSLNIGTRDSAEISDILSREYGILTRSGAHCAPLMHQALGTAKQGAVRFSFSHYNTREDIECAAAAIRELALE